MLCEGEEGLDRHRAPAHGGGGAEVDCGGAERVAERLGAAAAAAGVERSWTRYVSGNGMH